MARFMVTAQGNRGGTSRLGSAASGISAHPRGWRVGVSVYGYAEGDDDVFRISATGGSAGGSASRYLGSVRLVDGVPTFIPAEEGAS